jgi:hypothetical protein
VEGTVQISIGFGLTVDNFVTLKLTLVVAIMFKESMGSYYT